jgi:hypothetical protein
VNDDKPFTDINEELRLTLNCTSTLEIVTVDDTDDDVIDINGFVMVEV